MRRTARAWKESVAVCFTALSRDLPGWAEKNHSTLSQCPGRNLNRVPPDHERKLAPSEASCRFLQLLDCSLSIKAESSQELDSPLVTLLSLSLFTPSIFSFNFNIIFPFTPRSSKEYSACRTPDQNFVSVSYFRAHSLSFACQRA